jgi:hypothetical protein
MVAVSCDFCDVRPATLARNTWEEAANAAKAVGWRVEVASGECMCVSCQATALFLPEPHPDAVVQLADPLPGEGGEA